MARRERRDSFELSTLVDLQPEAFRKMATRPAVRRSAYRPSHVWEQSFETVRPAPAAMLPKKARRSSTKLHSLMARQVFRRVAGLPMLDPLAVLRSVPSIRVLQMLTP